MGIKLVTIDIDGTLLNSERKLTDEVKQAIKKATEMDVNIVLATGRPTIGVMPLIKELGLDNEHGFIITYNGGMIQNAGTQEILIQHPLPFEDYLDIELLSRKLGVHFHVQDCDRMYTANRDISEYTINEAFLTGIPVSYRAVSEMTPDINIIKSMMIDHEAVLDEAISKVPETFKEKFAMVKSAPYYYEILNKNATKGEAVKELAELLNIKPEEVMSIGDNENDLSMIEVAGVGVAMGNAVPAVKEIADRITKTNDEHGVAHAINEWVLK
ncbi:sugar-phosphatase [Vagococcus carniphilus]|uniref:sugar-phosphatase n=1 Tax=Vagococcus carniphilus TaxID=218144 RepID=UPI0028905C57|nr:sugar-phosphatase [Vagococcus carniphilus]MDT2816057.1 sugar-phosphatase [Vagococcus carniphilus]MDT2830862.1 sugar-phosphatase [Vagococcus carniphilus]MDT2839366.1 sugar-phosphatase [Vagococcus carniphilus]MDT2854025.1 sugar-phosphatase [Vagococcus carniphilus]MDT2866381.1 sugar-phosphatase [Vagococcus carniphilus]